jgi:predicted nucleic acid-binding protein
MIFLDTSVWVAAFSQNHPHSAASRPLLQTLSPDSSACAMHSLAEVYSALTRLPGNSRAHPREAMEYIASMTRHTTVIVVETNDYLETIDAIGRRGIGGAVVYDALLLACARKARAERIYTWNVRRFRMVAPDLAERIAAPGE